MAERPEQVDPALSAAGRHALHDEELIAAFAVDGDAADDPARARALIERCAMCRDLHADLVAIGGSIRAVASADSRTVATPAPRDFRLSASDAVRLRGGNGWQRLVARFLDGLATFGRPFGVGLATLGVVGLLVGSIGFGQLGLAPMSGPTAGGGAPGETFGIEGNAFASPTTDRTALGPSATMREEMTSKAPGAGSGAADSGAEVSNPASVVLGASGVLLVLGAALLIAGTRRRRLVPARRPTRT